MELEKQKPEWKLKTVKRMFVKICRLIVLEPRKALQSPVDSSVPVLWKEPAEGVFGSGDTQACSLEAPALLARAQTSRARGAFHFPTLQPTSEVHLMLLR